MKYSEYIKSIVILSIVMTMAACGNQTKESDNSSAEVETKALPEVTTSTTNDVLMAYLSVKTSLVDSDAEATMASANSFVSAIEAEASGSEWLSFASEAAMQISNAENLDMQRVAFEQLSDALIKHYAENPAPGSLYVQFCPMAFNDTGAYWISDSQEVLNPYFGDQMLRCGYVAAVIQ